MTIGFTKLPAIVQGYLEAMMFVNFNSDNPELKDQGYGDIAVSEVVRLKDMIEKWSQDDAVRPLIERALDGEGGNENYDEVRAGNDLYYTSCGHGTGFWDRGMGELGEELSAQARNGKFPEFDPYLGDDGKVYFA